MPRSASETNMLGKRSKQGVGVKTCPESDGSEVGRASCHVLMGRGKLFQQVCPS